jgi:hypothetical protein
MSLILFSVYYPHAMRTLLIEKAITPLLTKLHYTAFDFFLSTYKGENITIKLNGIHRSSKNAIQKNFDVFFGDYSVESSKVRLPVNRQFLDFGANTLHIWDFNPFKVGQRELDRIAVETHHSLLSTKCLSILVKVKAWSETSSFQVFTDLLLAALSYLSYSESDAEVFLGIMQSDLEKKLKQQKETYEKYLLKGIGIFERNRDSIMQYYERIERTVRDEEPADTEIREWMAIIKVWIEYKRQKNQNSIEQALASLVMDASQKIDLNPSGLIMAVGLLSCLIDK